MRAVPQKRARSETIANQVRVMQHEISKTDLRAVVGFLADYIALGNDIRGSTRLQNRIRLATVLKRKLEKKLSL